MPAVAERSFAAGEVGPDMYARSDMVPYSTGLRRLHNMYGLRQGGATKRPGAKYIRTMKVLGTKSHVFAFNEAVNQTYHLEFGYDAAYFGGFGTVTGSGYIRFTSNQSTLVLPAGFDGVTVTNWTAGTTYAIRALVSKGVRHYYAKAAHTDVASSHAPDTANGEQFWYMLPIDPNVTNGSIYEIPTPYLAADIWTTYPQQSGDTVIVTNRRPATATLASSSYVPHALRRFGHLSWDFLPIAFLPDINGPTGLTAVPYTVAINYRHSYKVTSISKASGKESIVGHLAASVTKLVTLANTVDVTIDDATAHGLVTGDEIIVTVVTPVATTTPLNQTLSKALLNQAFIVTVTSATVATLNDTAGIPYTASSHTIAFSKTVVWCLSVHASSISDTNPIYVSWTAVPGAASYAIYKQEQSETGSFGFLGTSDLPAFQDNGTPPDMSESPLKYSQVFLLNGNHPAVTGFLAQRLGFANTFNAPKTIRFSRTADLFNFTVRSPIHDDDAITAPIACRKFDGVRHFLEIGDGALVLGDGSEGILAGDADSAITPTTIRYKPQGYQGASRVFPLEIANAILYAKSRGNQLLEVQRSELGGYQPGIDPALFNSHFFGAACGCSIIAMAWAERPDAIVWVVRSDGVALSMAYLAYENVRCWSWSDTRGLVQHTYKDVVVVPEGSLDTPYFTVQRSINGSTVEYLEAMVPRCSGCAT